MPDTPRVTALYVGTQNDGLFIIDRPPRPAPADFPFEHGGDTRVIASMERADDEALREAKTMVAARNACFALNPQDPQKVAEGIPEAFRLLSEIGNAHFPYDGERPDDPTSWIGRTRALLTSLGLMEDSAK